MSIYELAALAALVAYAIYRQTQRREVVGHGRFKLAIIYAAVGLLVGGFQRPDSAAEVALLATSLALSAVVGLARGRHTRVWGGADGRVYSQGTTVTIALFLGLVAAKFVLGTVAYLTGISDDGGFGEVLLMIAVMVAFQAEIVWRRARPLGASRGGRSTGSSADRPLVAAS